MDAYNREKQSARDIELDNYIRTIFALSETNPDILYRVLELAREDKARSEK